MVSDPLLPLPILARPEVPEAGAAALVPDAAP